MGTSSIRGVSPSIWNILDPSAILLLSTASRPHAIPVSPHDQPRRVRNSSGTVVAWPSYDGLGRRRSREDSRHSLLVTSPDTIVSQGGSGRRRSAVWMKSLVPSKRIPHSLELEIFVRACSLQASILHLRSFGFREIHFRRMVAVLVATNFCTWVLLLEGKVTLGCMRSPFKRASTPENLLIGGGILVGGGAGGCYLSK